MDLLVSYSWNHYYLAKPEIRQILKHFGDTEPNVEKSGVMGIAIVHTKLDNREVIRKCRQAWQSEPSPFFQFAIKWVPVDYWCDTELAAMKQVINEKVLDRIGTNQTWGMKVKKRRWQKYHTSEIVEYLTEGIDRKVNLSQPDRWVWVDVVGKQTAIAVLKSDEIFSVCVSKP